MMALLAVVSTMNAVPTSPNSRTLDWSMEKKQTDAVTFSACRVLVPLTQFEGARLIFYVRQEIVT
jgi:hypothetical protein